jgi:hypothetical protein
VTSQSPRKTRTSKSQVSRRREIIKIRSEINEIETNNKKYKEMITRWLLEGRSRKCASYSEILERHWSHTLQAKPLRRGKTLTPPHLQLAQSISTSC